MITAANVDDWSDSRLFDYTQQVLGVGDVPEDDKVWVWRSRNTAILRTLRKQYHLTIMDVCVCVDYCAAHRIYPGSLRGLVRHWPDAQKWARQRSLAADVADLEARYQAAVEYERRIGDAEGVPTEWFMRLVRCVPEFREEVVTEWESQRSLVSSL